MNIDIVIIGRNSEKHLRECIESVKKCKWTQGEKKIKYIDGLSTDGSLEIAKSISGVEVYQIKDDVPSAAAGRNYGLENCTSEFIQFIDSDVCINYEWLENASSVFKIDSKIVAVKGNLKERDPNKNLYHLAASLEWNTNEGYCDEIGGIAMIRRDAMEKINGYSKIKSGEDPDLARRLIEKGGLIYHIDQTMGIHDINIDNLSQWFKRNERTGWTYSKISQLRLKKRDFFWIKEQFRILLRGLFPILLLILSVIFDYFYEGLFIIFLLIFQPMITSVPSIRYKLNITWIKAFKYSYICSLAIVPQVCGSLRYYLQGLKLSPIMMITIIFMLSSCMSVEPKIKKDSFSSLEIGEQKFETEADIKDYVFSSKEAINNVNANYDDIYKIGPGDKLCLNVWNREKLSIPELIVGPDGHFQIPRLGVIKGEGKTCSELNKEIMKKLEVLYEKPEVSLSVKTYNNNRAYVLGRVTNPGLINFQGRGTLLEALSLSGGLPILSKNSFLTRCAIIRGQDQIMWINLKELLNGNMGLNARILNGDIIYIPESGDEMAYVMGEVSKPGAISLKGRLSLLDAVMMSGGINESANENKVFLVRQNIKGRKVVEIDFSGMIERGDQSTNYLLKDNDIVFIGSKDIKKLNIMLNDTLPFLKVMSLGSGVVNSLGITRTSNQN